MNQTRQRDYKRKAYVGEIQQPSLKDIDLRYLKFNKSILYSSFLTFFIFCLIVAAGYLNGLLGGNISKLLFYSQQLVKGIWFTLCIVLVIGAWQVRAKHLKFAQGIWTAGVMTVLCSVLTWLISATIPSIFKSDSFWVSATLPPFFLGGYILAFLLTSFCLASFSYSMEPAVYQRLKYHFSIFVIVSSVLVAYWIGGNSPIELDVTKRYFGLVKVTSGLLGGLLILQPSLAFVESRKAKADLSFLRLWAIAYNSLGSTSFLNLDLSEADFTGANVANTDFRAGKFYRTCLKDVKGLDRARLDNRYFDIDQPQVQMLLTQGCCDEKDFFRVNLQGAYLQSASDLREFNFTDARLDGADLQKADLRGSTLLRTQLPEADLGRADLRRVNFTDANLTAATLRGADLRDCILVRAQVARADFTGADLTGVCIEDWSASSKTNFTNVRCDYIYRRYQDGLSTDRYPVDRNFEPDEFASLFQQPENQLELVFKGEFDYTALSLTFDKLQTDKPDLKLKLQGIEQRQDLWVVKVISDDPATVESRIQEIQDTVYQGYEITTTRLESNPLIRRIISDVANIRKTQEETVEEVKQLTKRIGSNFYFLGGTITNVTGAGEINYTEASNQVRSLVSSDSHQTQVANTLLNRLRSSNVATTTTEQVELIQFVIFEETQRDPRFRQSLLQQEQQILASLPESSISLAIRGAIAQLNQS
ncbi:MAG TPA: pentapeptide repeat-containing protein [Trichocoleus sp.]|jgi:uncharacterized protein YjbI with pentapeptide repeats